MPDRPQNPPQTGHEVIRKHLRQLDNAPGVYRMLDAQSRVLYVGKARALKKRVSSYAKPTGHSPRIARMIRETASMMFLTTRTETEALLLEQNLIKQLKPKYNVLLRDDKSFPNILVSRAHPFPQIKKHRGAKKEKGDYFGPFASAGAVNRTLNQLQKVFLLRNCSDATFDSRTRPCLLYQIKRCSAPCVGLHQRGGIRGLRRRRGAVPEGRHDRSSGAAGRADGRGLGGDGVRARRRAARPHPRADQRAVLAGHQPARCAEADVIALHMEGGQACVQVFFIRANQNWGNKDYYPRVGPDIDAPEVLEAFLGQFYDQKDPPRQLILSHPIENADLMADALSQKLGRKVEILVPQRGEKAELVDGALRNARESLARQMAESGAGEAAERAGGGLRPRRPAARIEVYDNSHIQGTNAVGAMIVAGPEGFVKIQYRKFNIRART
jgi:excinuclease ABC subunit C